nr:hypothetical protein GCM10020093_088420 [Planobispora longispora]
MLEDAAGPAMPEGTPEPSAVFLSRSIDSSRVNVSGERRPAGSPPHGSPSPSPTPGSRRPYGGRSWTAGSAP